MVQYKVESAKIGINSNRAYFYLIKTAQTRNYFYIFAA